MKKQLFCTLLLVISLQILYSLQVNANELATKEQLENEKQEVEVHIDHRPKGQIRGDPFQPIQGHVIAQANQISFSGVYTYMLWVKALNRVGGWGNIFHKGANDGQRNPAVWLWPNSLTLYVRSGNRQGGDNGCNSGAHVVIGEWTHIAVVHDGTGIYVYQNGFQICQNPTSGPIENTGPLYVSDPWYQAANALVADLRHVPASLSWNNIYKAYKSRVAI